MDASMSYDTFGSAVLPGTTNNLDPNSASPAAGDTGMARGLGPGQQGITAHVGSGATMISDSIIGLWDWLNRPFTQPMSPIGLALAVGVVLVAILFWNFIL